MTKHLLLLCAAFLASALVHSLCAQETAPPFRRYATQAYMAQLAKNYQAYAEARGVIEAHTFQFRTFAREYDTVFIPVVFHLMDNGKGGVPSDGDVAAQLQRLNIDFYDLGHPYASSREYFYGPSDALTYLHPADKYEGFARIAARPLIRFCRPQQDVYPGSATDGIIRHVNDKFAWGVGDSLKRAETGGSTAWDPAKYCNVWVARLADGTAGYAQMPGGPPETDGIVIDERYFARSGAPFQDGGEAPANVYGIGRTLCHLMGSYLNLYELWNDEKPCSDDLVMDTPVHNAPNYWFNEYKHISACNGKIEMTMNLMDCTADTAQYIFTYGQVTRMQACLALGGPRHALTQTVSDCGPLPSQDQGGSTTSLILVHGGDLDLRVFPNPATGDFNVAIQIPEQAVGGIEIRVFNTLGMQQWRSGEVTGPTAQFKVPAKQWAPGLYTVQALWGQRQQSTQVLLER